jgi:hypothetical protein
MTARKVLRKVDVAQSSLELPSVPVAVLEPVVDGSLALAVATVPAPSASSASSAAGQRGLPGLPPLTKARVHYWRELCGALSWAGTTGLPSAAAFPPAARPDRADLKALVAYGIVTRRKRAWHLTRRWHARLSALQAEAVDTPPLRLCERPAPGLPSYAELQAWEAICCWLDTQPRQRARLPFSALATFARQYSSEALSALGLGEREGETSEAEREAREGRDVPAGLLRGMRSARLVRHTRACEWVLAKAWRERLLALWQGYDRCKRELPAVVQAALAEPRSLVAGIDTWVLNWRVEEAEPLPPRLRKDLDDYQAQAREAETEVETRWLYDGVPLRMYLWGTKAEHGGGVSWSYVLLTPSLRLVIRKAALGGIIAQARLGAECLWRLTARRALDELDALVRRIWAKGGKEAGHWQVSQVHLAHDVANAPILEDWRDRFISRSRSQVDYEASAAKLHALRRVLRGARNGAAGNGGDGAGWDSSAGWDGFDDDTEDALDWGVDWDAEYGLDDADVADEWDALGSLGQRTARNDDDPFEEQAQDRAVTSYRRGKRLSGLTWSAGGPISVVLYRKDWELGRRQRAYMEPLWAAAGWQREEPVTRTEVRLRRPAFRALRLPNVSDVRALDNPWTMLDHLDAIFATVVGVADEVCPDAVNVSWLRLVVPSEEETNHARWETDPTWRVIQAAPFTPASASALTPARRLIRRTEHVRCAEQLDGILYGLLVRRVAELHPQGEQWDVSRAVGDVAPALTELAAQPEKEFGQRVRVRRQELGLPVARAGKVLPLRTSPPPLEPSEALAALDAEPPEMDQERAAWRARLAERRMREAHLALEEAEQQGASPQALESATRVFAQAVAVYTAAQTATGVHDMTISFAPCPCN